MVQEIVINSVRPFSFGRMASEMGIDPIVALRMRYRYLHRRLQVMKALYLECGDIDPYFWWWMDAANELLELVAYAKRYKSKPKGLGITDDMVLAAREYPITQLVEFIRGKAQAFCHDDRNPSAFHGSRNNSLVCPVCDKQFSSLDVLILRDGMSFPDAVRYLQ